MNVGQSVRVEQQDEQPRRVKAAAATKASTRDATGQVNWPRFGQSRLAVPTAPASPLDSVCANSVSTLLAALASPADSSNLPERLSAVSAASSATASQSVWSVWKAASADCAFSVELASGGRADGQQQPVDQQTVRVLLGAQTGQQPPLAAAPISGYFLVSLVTQ